MDHPLDGFRVEDAHHGGDRTVSFDGEILTVSYFRQDQGDFTYASDTRHFRLTEVKQQWVEVDES
jgi:hypothetical protein